MLLTQDVVTNKTNHWGSTVLGAATIVTYHTLSHYVTITQYRMW